MSKSRINNKKHYTTLVEQVSSLNFGRKYKDTDSEERRKKYLPKYYFVYLYIILEKLTPVVYNSDCLTDNHYVFIIPKTWYTIMLEVFKFESYLSMSTLIDMSCIDTKKFCMFKHEFYKYFKNHTLLYYVTLYHYSLHNRSTLFVPINKVDHLRSADRLYMNSNWIEREVQEMFGLMFTEKRDIRNLLLDYSKNEYPLLKEFPGEGFFDVFYDLQTQSIELLENTYIEL